MVVQASGGWERTLRCEGSGPSGFQMGQTGRMEEKVTSMRDAGNQLGSSSSGPEKCRRGPQQREVTRLERTDGV